MEVVEQKKEIIDWILSLENKEIVNDIYKFKNQQTTFDFDREFAIAITSDELKEQTTEYLKSLPWKK